jgi:hypothetical protein
MGATLARLGAYRRNSLTHVVHPTSMTNRLFWREYRTRRPRLGQSAGRRGCRDRNGWTRPCRPRSSSCTKKPARRRGFWNCHRCRGYNSGRPSEPGRSQQPHRFFRPVSVLIRSKKVRAEARATPQHLPELGLGSHQFEKDEVDDLRHVDAGIEHVHRQGEMGCLVPVRETFDQALRILGLEVMARANVPL